MQNHPGDGQPLPFPAGEAVAPFADHRVVAFGELHNPVVDVGGPGGGFHFLLGRPRISVQQVVADAGVEQVALLGYVPDETGQRRLFDLADVCTVDGNGAFGGVVQPGDQVGNGRLAGAAGADKGSQLTWLNLKTDAVQRPLVRIPVHTVPCRPNGLISGWSGVRVDRVIHPHRIEPDSPSHLLRGQFDGVRFINYLRPDIQVAENALEQGQRRLQFHRHFQQPADGEIEAALQRRECHDSSGGDLVYSAAHQHITGQQVDGDGRNGKEYLHQGEEGLSGHLPPDNQVRQPLVLMVKAVNLAALPAKKLGQHYAGN